MCIRDSDYTIHCKSRVSSGQKRALKVIVFRYYYMDHEIWILRDLLRLLSVVFW